MKGKEGKRGRRKEGFESGGSTGAGITDGYNKKNVGFQKNKKEKKEREKSEKLPNIYQLNKVSTIPPPIPKSCLQL